MPYWPPMAEVAGALPGFWPCVVGVCGAVAGSFANCMAYRVPRRLPLAHPPSACPACNARLKIVDLVPVVSYVGLRGKCRHCKTPIPLRSLGVEMAFVAWALAVYVLVGPQALLWPALVGALGVAVVITIALGWRAAWPQSHSPRRKAR